MTSPAAKLSLIILAVFTVVGLIGWLLRILAYSFVRNIQNRGQEETQEATGDESTEEATTSKGAV